MIMKVFGQVGLGGCATKFRLFKKLENPLTLTLKPQTDAQSAVDGAHHRLGNTAHAALQAAFVQRAYLFEQYNGVSPEAASLC